MMDDKFPYYYDKEIDENTNKKINAEILKYAGIYVLKKLDPEAPEYARYDFNVPLPVGDEILEPVLDDLLYRDLIKIDTKSAKYILTEKGNSYIVRLIEEIEGYINKYKDYEPDTRINLLKRDGLNPLRVRFLWGWYDGEFDDIVQFQETMDFDEDDIIDSWQEFIVAKDFYDTLFEDINVFYDFTDEELNEAIKEADKQRQEYLKNQTQQDIQTKNSMEDTVVEERRDYYYQDPYYYNPIHDPLFWFIVFW